MKCRVCDRETKLEFARNVLGRHLCHYFYCAACGFLQTEDPHWLDEAYQSAIANADTGLVYRNVHLSKIVSTLLFFAFERTGRYLDAAGGYGMFTRLMRDIGFDFFWSDLYCQNLLARGFEASTTAPPFAAVTAFEVLEHVPRPVDFIAETLATAQSRTLIFSTELFSGTPPAPDGWWYYSFETGQHIAFYQVRTLEFIAGKLGLRCYSNGSIHMLTDRDVSPTVFRMLTSPRLARVLSLIPRRRLISKMVSDNHAILIGKR